MKTHKIWEKDDFFGFIDGPNRVDMDPSVVVLPNDFVVAAWQFDFTNVHSLVGRMTNIRLEGEEILGDFTSTRDDITEKFIEEMGLVFGGYYVDVEYHAAQGEETKQVASCRLQAVGLTFDKPGAANPMRPNPIPRTLDD